MWHLKLYNPVFSLKEMLTPEQVKQLKEQLLSQLGNFPEDKREMMKEQILMMDDKQFEEFLIQNGLIGKGEGEEAGSKSGEEDETEKSKGGCVFCSILGGKVPSYKIDENKNAVAILEINPLSKGHMLVVPKEHGGTEKIPSSAFALAKKIARKIKSKFKPKEIRITTQTIMGHAMVEVLPLYGTEKERKKATEKELFDLQRQLISQAKEKPAEEEKPRKKEESKEGGLGLPKLKPRIP